MRRLLAIFISLLLAGEWVFAAEDWVTLSEQSSLSVEANFYLREFIPQQKPQLDDMERMDIEIARLNSRSLVEFTKGSQKEKHQETEEEILDLELTGSPDLPIGTLDVSSDSLPEDDVIVEVMMATLCDDCSDSPSNLNLARQLEEGRQTTSMPMVDMSLSRPVVSSTRQQTIKEVKTLPTQETLKISKIETKLAAPLKSVNR